ncbi:ABC transporter permease [Dinghuibacter silviterrae]|uniref:Putative ABC transport system permease protein n=1 Tax=Dinghuibacter silviterrae TaxID=1539049 RepID=A0A4R8DNU9_9BACT|nr:ABC transporter permease [Dinghuibacter silviterrae]TDW99713.1 putative ABC transport system permease protein [Dinghuibacter silviterrae]
MFQTNLRIALRNLWKYKGFSLVNVLGLSISLAGCILILLYVFHEHSYDRWNKNAGRVFRVAKTTSDNPGRVGASTPGEIAPLLKDRIPEIAAYTRFYVFDIGRKLAVNRDKNIYIDHVQGVDSTFFQVFPYTFVEGDPAHALDGPYNLVISDVVARRLFGHGPALGKTIRWQERVSLTVTGVFKTPDAPTHFEADAFHKINSTGDGWWNSNFYTYILAGEGTDGKALETKINQALDRMPLNQDTSTGAVKTHIQLVPVRDMYFRSDISNDFTLHGNARILQVLLGVALLLLVIACINFTNFNITQSVRRSRETGVRKVMGAHRLSLALYYLLETSVQVVISLLLSLVLAELFLPGLGRLLNADLGLFMGGAWKELAGIACIGVLVIGASGGYVAYYISGLDPVRVLKGEYQGKGRGALLRKVLLVVQFAFAALAVGALLVIHTQEKYMESLDPGFHKDQVMVVNFHRGGQREHWDATRQRLLSLPGVRMVSKVNYLPGDVGMQVIGREYNGEPVKNLDVITVGYDYFEVMGIRLDKGRFFNSAYGLDSNSLVLNQTAARQYHIPALGTPWIDHMPIVGIVGDINQRGFETPVEPTAYMIESDNTNACNNVLLKIDASRLPQTIRALNTAWLDIEPGFPLEYHFLDQQFDRMFLQYHQMDILFTAFSALTLGIALLGIFVLSAFIALQRSREIGIRKVLGASVQEVVRLLSTDFLVLVLLANAIALPCLYVLGQRWLQGFPYRVTLPWFAFAGTLVLTLACTLITVSIQAWKAAMSDPVKALKYE